MAPRPRARYVDTKHVLRGVATALIEDRDRRFNVLDTRGGVLHVRSGGTGGRVGDFFVRAGAGPEATIYQDGGAGNAVTVDWGDVKVRDRDIAVARVLDAVVRYEASLPTRAERAATHTRPVPHRPLAAILGHAERARLMEALDAGGLSGKHLFPTIGDALGHAGRILAAHGLELSDALDAREFRRDVGQISVDLARTNPADPFSPVAIRNTNATIHWHRFQTGRVEVMFVIGMVAE